MNKFGKYRSDVPYSFGAIQIQSTLVLIGTHYYFLWVMTTHMSCNDQLMRRINQEHSDPRNLKRHNYLKADTTFVEFEHEGITYKRFVLGQNKCAQVQI
jgi:hypothetical protein